MKQRIPLSKIAYNAIMQRVVGSEFRTGQTFTEEFLKKELKISRTPIREALGYLQSEGIISKNGRSFSVVYLNENEIDEIYEVRRELESLAAYLSAIRMSTEERKELKKFLKTVIRASNNNTSPVTLTSLNGKLHSLISAGSKNSLILKELENIRLKLTIVRVSILSTIERREKDLNEHVSIVNAIINFDPEEARRKMYEHQTNVWAYVKYTVIPKLYY
jgi:DNA-binding GntR family transcriptional regulator